MKEVRFFYTPDVNSNELPPDEATHALRVLRLSVGDELMLMDGNGCFYRAVITLASGKRCLYDIVETIPQSRQWGGKIHLAIAPTKMMERVEWLVEKATEIGIDEFSFLDCQFSERRVLKTERLEKIIVAAVKQSHKAWKPIAHELQGFHKYISTSSAEHRYIAHCYEEIPRRYLFDELEQLDASADVAVLIGPEGDFSINEVREAVAAGYTSVHLGASRLRTETAGLSAVMMMHLSKTKRT